MSNTFKMPEPVAYMWFCRGFGALAMGDTWKEALKLWGIRIKLTGNWVNHD